MAVLALVLLAAPVGAAQAAWQSTAVPFAGEFGSGTLSAAPDGTFFASAAFGNPVKAYLSPRPPFGPFAAAVPYPAGGAVGAAMDFDAAGNAVMLSTAGAGTLATYRPAGAVSAFGPNQTLTAATAFAGLSVSPGGAALSAFAAYPGPSAVQVADRPAGAPSAFTTPVNLPGNPTSNGGFGIPVVQPFLDPDGGATVVYSTYDGLYDLVQVARATGGAAFGSPGAPFLTNIPVPKIAMNAAGDAALLWAEGSTIKSSYRPHDGVFGAAQTVGTGATSFFASLMQFGMDKDGRAIAAWSDRTAGCGSLQDTIHLASTNTTGAWNAPQTTLGLSPVLATSETGTAFVLLYRLAGGVTGDHCSLTVPVQAVADSGSAGVLALTPADLPGQATATGAGEADLPEAAAIDGAGNALVLWTTGTNGPLRAAANESGTPPPGGGGTIPTPTPTPTPPPASPVTPTGPGTQPTLDGFGEFLARAPGTIRASAVTSVPIEVICRAGTCSVYVEGSLVVRSGARTSARTKPKSQKFKLARVNVKLSSGQKRTVKLKLSKKARTAVRSALKGRRSVVANMTVRNGRVVSRVAIRFRAK